MAKVLALYCSSYRHVEKLAHEIVAGAQETGASADVQRVPGTSISGGRQGSQLQARPDDFAESDAIVRARASAGCRPK
jgi:multimeric flavodoxin WrbA